MRTSNQHFMLQAYILIITPKNQIRVWKSARGTHFNTKYVDNVFHQALYNLTLSLFIL